MVKNRKKQKQTQSNGDIKNKDIKETSKRKKKFSNHPPSKRVKFQDKDEEESYSERFKYILAPKNDNTKSNKSTPAKKKAKKSNGAAEIDEEIQLYGNLGKANLMSIYGCSESETESDDHDWEMNGDDLESSETNLSLMDEDMESSFESDDSGSSEELDEEEEDEWETDTDYSEHSFHESDCYEIASDDDNMEYDSTDDEDYVPPIEDKYVKKGEAILYTGKGLDLAFGDSSESQIVEISEIDAEVIINSDEDIPPLIPINVDGETLKDENVDKASSEFLIDEGEAEEEETVKSSQLLERISFYMCAHDKGVIAKISGEIFFHGILSIRPLINTVQINGYTLKKDDCLSATSISRADYYLNLTPVIDEICIFDKKVISNELKDLLEPTYNADTIIDNFDCTKEVLVHLQQGLPNSIVATIETYSTYQILPHKNILIKNSACPSSELMLRTKFFVDSENQKLNCFKISEDWNYIDLKPDIKLMIIGGKNVGKSSLTQYLINKSITNFEKILLIDLDIGQPIVSPSQTVSASLITGPLIGAGFLSDMTPDKSILFGNVSVMVDPYKYTKCVEELFKFCNNNVEYKNIPWVINTMGFQKGIGLQLMCILLKMIQPTEIIQIQHKNHSYNFQSILTSVYVNEFESIFFPQDLCKDTQVSYYTHVIGSIVNNDDQGENKGKKNQNESKWISNASEKRKISMIAQLGKLMSGGQKYLNEVEPFCIQIDSIRMIVIDEEYQSTDSDMNLQIFNGNLVYLCHDNGNCTKKTPMECYGVGVVRAIDRVHRKIYVVMPESVDIMSNVNMIALGYSCLPAEVLLKQNFDIDSEVKVPYVTYFKKRNLSGTKYINRRNIKDIY